MFNRSGSSLIEVVTPVSLRDGRLSCIRFMRSEHDVRARAAIFAIAFAAGCACDGAPNLYVELISDLSTGGLTPEIDRVRTEVTPVDGALDGGPIVQTLALDASSDLLMRLRVAELEGLPPGDYDVRVILERGGAEVLVGQKRVTVRANIVVTFLLARRCGVPVRVDCPPPSDPSLTSCFDGVCADPRCPDEPEFCPPPSCDEADPSTCVSDECFDAACVESRCLQRLRADAPCGCPGAYCPLDCAAGTQDCDRDGMTCEADLTSAATCGACGIACSGVTPLCAPDGAGGVHCSDSCVAGVTTLCGAACVDTSMNVLHCGGCDRPCALPHAVAACVGGTCYIASCESGYYDCNAMPADGCERPLGTDQDCSACGDSCGLGACCDGACTDTSSASLHCGGCGIACAAGELCCDGSCSDTDADVFNCGGCGAVCTVLNATPACSGGRCSIGSCDSAFRDCDGDLMTGCETDITQPWDCQLYPRCSLNGCGTSVPNASRWGCYGGSCVIAACNAGFEDCDGMSGNGCESRLATDEANCGACGSSCGAGETCMGGSCTCGSRLGMVGGGQVCDPAPMGPGGRDEACVLRTGDMLPDCWCRYTGIPSVWAVCNGGQVCCTGGGGNAQCMNGTVCP